MLKGKKTLIFLFIFVILAVAIGAWSLLPKEARIHNTGKVRTIGVEAYWEMGCINVVQEIEWGLMEPGSNKTVEIYIKNPGNSAAVLNMTTENWAPLEAAGHLNLTWNLEGVVINPGEVLAANLTLTVSLFVEGVDPFSFDIIIITT